jgi:hypothetical protein
MTFRDMFYKVAEQSMLDFAALNKTLCYTYVLRHPENRIVCSVPVAHIVRVQETVIHGDCTVEDVTPDSTPITLKGITSWDTVRKYIHEWDIQYRYNVQGIVVKSRDGRRWKLRTPSYNAARHMRGNTARRDFVWLNAWRNNTLYEYLACFPEEKLPAESTIAQWKRITNDVFHIYTDVFKARTLSKNDIPLKYRPFVYGLHTKYMDELRPAGRSIDWKTTLQYMNDRDTAQMLFVMNWEKRQAAKQQGTYTPTIPVEPDAYSASLREGRELEEGEIPT